MSAPGPKFGLGDKIFAKVRGYPPWPARVEGVADETPNKMKYHVYFYGTGETAICKQEELFPYLENKDKYGKQSKKKGFNDALVQISTELGLSPSLNTSQLSSQEQDSEAEGSLIIDETPGKKTKSNLSTPASVTTKDSSVRKKDTSDNDNEDSVKRPRKRTQPSDQDSPSTSQKTTPSDTPVMSRSGRKIKQKRYSSAADDQDLDAIEHVSTQAKHGSKTTGTSVKSKVSTSAKGDMELDAELINDSTLVAFTPKGEEIRLKLNLNKPVVFKTDKARLEWEAKVLEGGRTLKAQIESGEILPESVKKEIQEKYQDKLTQLEHSMAENDKKEKLEYLKIEAQLLDIDVRIKGSLSLKQADPESCLKYLDELSGIKVNPLMFKKHPEVVDTIKKLRKYVGNTGSWSMTEEETSIFANKAASIRAKAEHVYNKIKMLFLVPYGKSFWDVFSKELKEFTDTIKGMTSDDIFALTSDPTEKKLTTADKNQKDKTNSLNSSAAL